MGSKGDGSKSEGSTFADRTADHLSSKMRGRPDVVPDEHRVDAVLEADHVTSVENAAAQLRVSRGRGMKVGVSVDKLNDEHSRTPLFQGEASEDLSLETLDINNEYVEALWNLL